MTINWNKIDQVFFDMDGTLLDLHYDNHFWQHHLPHRFAEINALPKAIAQQQLSQQIQALQGQLNWYCIDYWSETLKLDIMALKHEIADRIQWRPYAKALLEYLTDLGKPLYLVTNAHPKSIQIKHQHQPLTHYFNDVFSSHNFSAAKESPKFWHTLKKAHNFPHHNTVFFDDNLSVLESAQKNGQLTQLYAIQKPDSQQPSQLEHIKQSSFKPAGCFSDFILQK